MNPGDTIICVDTDYDGVYISEFSLSLNSQYKIVDIRTINGIPVHYLLRGDNHQLTYYDIYRFISLQKYRELQINKLIKN